MSWELAAFGMLPRFSLPLLGFQKDLILLSGLLFGKVVWKMSVVRVCAPIGRGGLNIVHFITKCDSLRISSFQSLRDEFSTAKWHFLACYFLGNRLASLYSRFCSPRISCPSSSEPSTYYHICLNVFTRLYTKFGSLPDDLSCKHVHDLLLVLPGVAPRCAGFSGKFVLEVNDR